MVNISALPGGFPRGRPARHTFTEPAGSFFCCPRLTVVDPICSSKGCRNDATWELHWNNPKLHTPERRKIWLACDEHRASLSAFLEARGFLRETVART